RSVPDVTGDGSVGGIAARDGFILNSTITDNEGGENSPSGLSAQDSSFSLTTVRNSIIAGNRNSSTVPEVSGTGIVSEGSNLIGNPGTVTAFDEPGDQTGVSTADLGLGPLAANGGPTPTHALDMDSLAVDAVLNPCPDPATDQRGVTRPQGTACDIGAFERETGPSDAEHDLAGLKITGPRTVTLTSSKPVQTKTVKVQLQNQGQEAETIPDAAALAALVQVGLTSLDTVMDCADVLGTLDASKLEFPLTLQAGEEPTKGQKLTLAFTVTFDRAACIPDPLKTSKKDPGHEDYRPWASIDLGALGETDSDPTDDMLEGELIDIVDKL
ncbi:MAG: choice-of-anchor Q domain-containing protein, partial [Candidatus Binatia bacterium]